MEQSEKQREAYVRSFTSLRYTEIRKSMNYFEQEILITLRDLLNMKKEEEPWDR